jgi:Protein of unknown function (DUF3037)
MKQLVCNYAPLRFLPYWDVGEFVNVGVVLHCPQVDYFGFRLAPSKRTGRVSGFFPELDTKVFKAALQGIKRELALVQSKHRPLPTLGEVAPQIAKEQAQRFLEVIRRREGLLHFGDAGTLLSDTPREALDGLFGRFVERQFAQKREYQENVMRDRLEDFLHDWNLAQYYQMNRKVGDNEFHVVMPFVYYQGEVPAKAIKTLDLDKDEPSDVYDHGGAWVEKMERLKGRKQLPPAVVFTVRFPEIGKRMKAAEEICDELRQLGVESVAFNDPLLLRKAVRLDFTA